MQIDKELLSERNYTGSRLIEIVNPKLDELQVELSALQQEINPVLDKLSAEYYPKLDPLYKEVQELNEKVKALKDQIGDITRSFQPDIEIIESTEQKATLVKNKMQPLIQKEIEGKLEEFEIARHTVVKDGKLYVEVFDEIEEKVKAIRVSKAKK